MSYSYPDVYIAIPVLNEFNNLPAMIESIKNQDYKGRVMVYICVNQPESWWKDKEKIAVCNDNKRSLEFLSNLHTPCITLIDKSSAGKGWIGRKHGVGYARREVMEAIAKVADDDSIIISLDADTGFNPSYFDTVVKNLQKHPQAVALAVPYYHRLTGDEKADRAILRYEIYMRYYAINLFRIGSPYAFTALGSAIALRVKDYKSIGGITPKMSGEDFYFLQKLRKKGLILTWNSEKVYPAARFSDRVYFGTGPAMLKGAAGDWSSYPIYRHVWFDEIMATYQLFTGLFTTQIKTPMDDFLEMTFPEEDIWEKLRSNAGSLKNFVRACHQKIDGLRVLQYLKWKQRQATENDEKNLVSFLETFFPDADILRTIQSEADFSFSKADIGLLNEIRDYLVLVENEYQKGMKYLSEYQ